MFKFNFPEIDTRNTINSQVWKIKEETSEVELEQVKIVNAKLRGEKPSGNALVMETLDLIQACETLLRIMDVPQAKLDKMHDEVIRKNRVRGYYKEESNGQG